MESKILHFTMHGMTNIQSAKILKTGAKIISSHKRNIMIKVGAKSKQELYYLAKPIYTGGLFK
ncbi:helix-turn-helix domain-containing protein [Hafnia alvei]|uniref:helix-turn-helix domain-containing protein n=1 Tax=Hafnia alvei TaxID=569 RepID=UPI000907E77A